MSDTFTVHIYTPEAPAAQMDATYLAVHGVDGGYGLMRGHLPCVIGLAPGELTVTTPRARSVFLCGDGFLEMRDNVANIFVSSCKEVK